MSTGTVFTIRITDPAQSGQIPQTLTAEDRQRAATVIPNREQCIAQMQREQMPEHIRAHSEQVARLALWLAQELEAVGQGVDRALLEAGALLHDIRKIQTIQEGGDHARLGGQWAVEVGYEELAPLIERHVNLGDWDPEGPITEIELVNYADKRVCHTEVVSLGERFEDLLERYGKTEGARQRIRAHWETVQALETKIFSRLHVAPDKLGA